MNSSTGLFMKATLGYTDLATKHRVTTRWPSMYRHGRMDTGNRGLFMIATLL